MLVNNLKSRTPYLKKIVKRMVSILFFSEDIKFSTNSKTVEKTPNQNPKHLIFKLIKTYIFVMIIVG